MDFTQVKTAAIIGAGVSGLATARTLIAQGVTCTVFERNAALGGVWTDGYVNFGVQVQKELYEFPDWPLPETTPHFTPGPVFQDYLEGYADHFGICPHIRFDTTADRLAPAGNGTPKWRVTFTAAGETGQEDFDLAVVCVGLYSNIPHMPTFPGQESFRGEISHVYAVKSQEPLEGKRVAVLGFGKSATDAALEAAAVARDSHIIIREPHWPVPRKLAGILPFKWGLLNRLTVTVIPPYKHPSRLERVVHGLGKPLVWLFWRLVEILLYFQCRLGSRFGTRPSLVPNKPIEIDAFGESTMLPRPNFYRLARQGRITVHRTEIARYTPDGVELKDGTRLELDLMVLGTGWRSDYGFLPEELRKTVGLEDDGLYLYRQMLHPDMPGLVFVGHASTVSSILTYCLQARWLAELIAGRHALPGRDAMLEEIAQLKAWKRSWMPYSNARSARLIVHMQHYHDELLEDFGANPLRKRGFWAPLKELIEPYQPSDYRAVASGDWEHLEDRARRETA
jgi:dimethylaniline monooxygenase (N-oxide forming)